MIIKLLPVVLVIFCDEKLTGQYAHFCLLGGQVVRFQLASCGQDSHLKIWAINQLHSGGTVTSSLHAVFIYSKQLLKFHHARQNFTAVQVDVTCCNAVHFKALHLLAV